MQYGACLRPTPLSLSRLLSPAQHSLSVLPSLQHNDGFGFRMQGWLFTALECGLPVNKFWGLSNYALAPPDFKVPAQLL